MMAELADLVSPIRIYQMGDGVPVNEWEMSMLGAASVFRSYDPMSAVDRALKSYGEIYTRTENRRYKKSELVTHLYGVCDIYDLDRAIAYSQIEQESSFNELATGRYCVLGITNRKCSVGVAQFIPATAEAYGLRVDREVDERFDPIKSLNSYGALMHDLLAQYDGDYMRALAAYNAGPGVVNKAIARNGEGWLSAMPAETQIYIVKILGARAITDPAIIQSTQQAIERGRETKIGIVDILLSDLGPDLIKRWLLWMAAMTILAIALLPAVVRIYKGVK